MAVSGAYIKAPDKRGYPQNSFLIPLCKHMLWVSLEAHWEGASNEYPQHMFMSRNKKNICNFRLKKKSPYPELCLHSECSE